MKNSVIFSIATFGLILSPVLLHALDVSECPTKVTCKYDESAQYTEVNFPCSASNSSGNWTGEIKDYLDTDTSALKDYLKDSKEFTLDSKDTTIDKSFCKNDYKIGYPNSDDHVTIEMEKESF